MDFEDRSSTTVQLGGVFEDETLLGCHDRFDNARDVAGRRARPGAGSEASELVLGPGAAGRDGKYLSE